MGSGDARQLGAGFFEWRRRALVDASIAGSQRHEGVPAPNYRNRPGAGVLSSSGAGVGLGSASGVEVLFFFFVELFFVSGPRKT